MFHIALQRYEEINGDEVSDNKQQFIFIKHFPIWMTKIWHLSRVSFPTTLAPYRKGTNDSLGSLCQYKCFSDFIKCFYFIVLHKDTQLKYILEQHRSARSISLQILDTARGTLLADLCLVSSTLCLKQYQTLTLSFHLAWLFLLLWYMALCIFYY